MMLDVVYLFIDKSINDLFEKKINKNMNTKIEKIKYDKKTRSEIIIRVMALIVKTYENNGYGTPAVYIHKDSIDSIDDENFFTLSISCASKSRVLDKMPFSKFANKNVKLDIDFSKSYHDMIKNDIAIFDFFKNQ